MLLAAELGGSFAAHAIWSVSDGAFLIPMLASAAKGERAMQRLVGENQRMVEIAREQLDSNAADVEDAALLYDGYLTINGEKLDTIFVEMRAYFMPGARLTLGIPYTPASTGKFRVHKPKLLDWIECDDFAQQDVFAAFFRGVDAHEQGSAIWNAALDQSK